jgi:hypothetical protein
MISNADVERLPLSGCLLCGGLPRRPGGAWAAGGTTTVLSQVAAHLRFSATEINGR